MAIQHRRGKYADFDPTKLLPGEIAVILSGDPASNTGRSIYICFEAGVVKRFTTYEDFETEIQNATEEVQATFTEEMRNAIDAAITATNAANNAQAAANAAAEAANQAAEAAGAYVLGDVSQKTVAFTEAASKALPATGETLAVLMGKIRKYLTGHDTDISSLNTKINRFNLVVKEDITTDSTGQWTLGIPASADLCVANSSDRVYIIDTFKNQYGIWYAKARHYINGYPASEVNLDKVYIMYIECD